MSYAPYSNVQDQYYYGFYQAKVINNIDPEGRGRVQLRVLGLHSNNTNESFEDGIPDDDLPWAEQAAPILGGFASTNKPGITVTPEPDSLVWIFFWGGNHNSPIYFAQVVCNGDRDSAVDSLEEDKSEITVIKTKSGNKIKISDVEDNEEIVFSIGNTMAAIQIKNTKSKGVNINITSGSTSKGEVNIQAGQVNIMSGSSGNKGYPILAEGAEATVMINGQTFKSAKTALL